MGKREKRCSTTTVKHKRNFQRSLNRFAENYKGIDVTFNGDDSVTFYCYNEAINPTIIDINKSNTIYTEHNANIRLKDINCINEAIDSMFEYNKYLTIIKEIIFEYEAKMLFDGTTVYVNKFFTLKKDIIDVFHDKFESKAGKKFTKRFISKLYTSIKNRIIFKPLYVDEKGDYLTYYSSQHSNYKPPSYFTSQVTIIKTYYNSYLKYKDMFSDSKAKAFAYYLDESKDGKEFVKDCSIAKEWRNRYEFLVTHGIIDEYETNIHLLAEYIKPYTHKNGTVINFIEDGSVFEDGLDTHLESYYKEKKYNLKKLSITHKSLQKVMSISEQDSMFSLNKYPSFEGIVAFYEATQ